MNYKRSLTALCILAFTAPGIAVAKPQVSLHLSAFVLGIAHGKPTMTPLDNAAHKSIGAGTRVRFVIEARNKGASAALHLTPSDPIPPRMTYVPGSARDGNSTIEFSLDGKTFSSHPTIKVKTAKGLVSKPADPSMYKAIRWITHVPLPAHRTFTYSYEAQVNGSQKGAK